MRGTSSVQPPNARAPRPRSSQRRRATRLVGRLLWLVCSAAGAFSACREPLATRPGIDPNSTTRGGGGDGVAGAPQESATVSHGGKSQMAGGAGDSTSAAGAAGITMPSSQRPPIVTCPAHAPLETCEIRGDSSKGLRLIGTLLEPDVTRSSGMLDLDATGAITCAACDCGDDGGKLVIECPNFVVTPGFINLHDHLGYAGTPPLSHPGELYEHRSDWRLGEHGHAALSFSGGASVVQVLAQELRHVMAGTTSIVGAGGRRGLARNLEVPSLTEGLLPGEIRAETFPLDDARGVVDSAACHFGETPDTSATPRDVEAYVPHVGEGTDQRAEDELRCALGGLGLLRDNTAVVHAMALSRDDARALAERGSSVIWSPRSNLDLYGSTAPVALLSSLGVRIALGTDWLASGSMNLLRELDCAKSYADRVLGGYFDAAQLLRMTTENPAWALRLEGRLGELRRGLIGDVAVFAAQPGQDAYESVLGAQAPDVMLVLRGGTPLYGDAALVQAFRDGQACESLTVCGAEKRACVVETGHSLDEIRSAGEAVYPLFSCGPPPNEPSCRPLTDRECPFGEEACPEPEPAPAWSATDADGDGVPDLVDDCPRAADPEQLDADADGRGDACDSCPVFNPGLSPCPSSVARLRSPQSRVARHTSVLLKGVHVTAVRSQGSKGFYVEDGDRAPYSGIFVYTGSTAPPVTVNDVIDLRGYFDSFEGTDELVDAEVIARSAVASPYEPTLVELAELADGSPDAAAFASRLVRITAARVELMNPDSPMDYDETLLSGGLRLDDLIFTELDNTYPAGTVFGAIQGIAGFSFKHQKLYPRELEDLSSL